MVESQYASDPQRSAARRKTRAAEAAAPGHPVLRMQRQLGNQQVARMLAQRVGAEEDEMMQGKHDVALAQRVGAEEDEMMQGKHDAALAQRVGAEEEEKQGKHDAALAQRVGAEEDEMMQGKHDAALAQRAPAAPTVGLEGGPVGEDLQSRIDSKRGGGSGLSDTVRATAEASLGTSFADVRVHRDAESDALNRAITAKAFTTGSDIFLREDQNPGDMNLMAHELTHVVQQRGGGGGVSRMLTVGAADDPYEREADSVADAVVSGQGQRALDEMKG